MKYQSLSEAQVVMESHGSHEHEWTSALMIKMLERGSRVCVTLRSMAAIAVVQKSPVGLRETRVIEEVVV